MSSRNQLTAAQPLKGAKSYGLAKFTGTGAATVFNIPTGLNVTPSYVQVQPAASGAIAGSGGYSVSVTTSGSGFTIVVTYAAAPSNGASVWLYWRALI